MGYTERRYRDTHLERFAGLLRAWLGSLPAGGWRGTVRQLQAVFDAAAAGHYVGVPGANGLTMQLRGMLPLIRECGWSVAWKRNKQGRWIEVTKR
jgi:hypothetical protein